MLAFVAGATAAEAQSDRASRDDTADYRRKLHARKPQSPATSLLLEEGKSTWTGTLGLSGAYATNPGYSATNPVRTFYGTPSLAVAYSKPENPIASGSLGFDGKVTVDADVFAKQPGNLNESRIAGEAMFSRKLDFGTLAFGVQEQSTWDSAKLYGDYTYSRAGAVIKADPAFADAIKLSIETEYRISDIDEERRWLIDASAEHGLGTLSLSRTCKIEITLKEELIASFFRSGVAAGRRDLRSNSTLVLDPGLFAKKTTYKFEIDATLFQNFSNRADKRFTDFEIGPSLSATF